jgi:hypothetical protein
MNPAVRTALWVGLGLALAACALALALLWLLFGTAHGGIDIHVNGQPLALHAWPAWRDWPAAMGAGAVLFGALLLAVAVPVMLLALLAVAALGGAVAIAGVLLTLALVALLALSPLWLPLLLAWLMLRRRRPAPTPALQP